MLGAALCCERSSCGRKSFSLVLLAVIAGLVLQNGHGHSSTAQCGEPQAAQEGVQDSRNHWGCCGEGCDQATAGSWQWAGSAGIRGKTFFPCLLEKLFQATW